jgi:23S rRNA (guanosine2251-2'-O)-methyltransferase
VEPDAEVIAGRRPVEEAFAAGREARRLIVVPHRRAALEKLVLHATTLRIPVIEVEGGTLTSLTGFDGHQGIALVASARRFSSLDEVLQRAAERGEAPLLLALDSLEDPQNFGALLRTAEASGVHGVLYPTRHAAPLSAAAVKASAGAVEHLLLVPVDDLGGALTDAHARGLRIVGADADAPLSYRETDLRGPLVLVVGSEGQGVSGPIRRRLDFSVSIPMTGRVASLNAAVAGSVLLVEAAGQRQSDVTQPAAQRVTADEPQREPATSDSPATSEGAASSDSPATSESPATSDRPTRAKKVRSRKAAPTEKADGPPARADGSDAPAAAGPASSDAGPEPAPTAATDADLLPD